LLKIESHKKKLYNTRSYYSLVYFLLFSLSFVKESREKKKVTKKKREKENFIKLIFIVSVFFY